METSNMMLLYRPAKKGTLDVIRNIKGHIGHGHSTSSKAVKVALGITPVSLEK